METLGGAKTKRQVTLFTRVNLICECLIIPPLSARGGNPLRYQNVLIPILVSEFFVCGDDQ